MPRVLGMGADDEAEKEEEKEKRAAHVGRKRGASQNCIRKRARAPPPERGGNAARFRPEGFENQSLSEWIGVKVPSGFGRKT